jgi:hypothetical protein
MPDNLRKRRPQDSSRVNIHEPYEVRWWTEEFGCTEQQLKNAVAKVGTSAAAVKRHLSGKYAR